MMVTFQAAEHCYLLAGIKLYQPNFSGVTQNKIMSSMFGVRLVQLNDLPIAQKQQHHFSL